MATARPLHDIFTALTGDPAARPEDLAGVLRDAGHPDLPDGLVAEAIVSYADTADVEVAEHLAPFVTAHSAVPPGDPQVAGMDVADGWELIATAPAGALDDAEPLPVAGEADADYGSGSPGDAGGAAADPFDLAFGEGRGPGEVAGAGEVAGPGGFGDDPGAAEPVPVEPGGSAGPELPDAGPDPEDFFPVAGPPERDHGVTQDDDGIGSD